MLSRAMIDQVLKLKQSGHSIRKIALALKVSRNSVRKYLRDLDQPSTAVQSSSTISGKWVLAIDWDKVILQRKKGVTVKQLFTEYGPPVDYSVFARHLRTRLQPALKPAIPLDHEPGERCQIDYADGIKITDPKTGALTKTHLFCGVLPFSSYTFAEFVMDQKLQSFIRSHERMWAYFGGITPYVVIDNLKSGVKKAHRYDPEVNPTYCDFANKTGFVTLPARPYTPRDKASVESNIGAIQRSFFQQFRDHKFYSLAELNEVFRRFLDEFNAKIMPDHGVSRKDRFEYERHRLIATSVEPYSIADWKPAKVHPDCCIQVAKALYSVPFRYQGQSVRVKISENLIEIFDQDTNCIACHKKVAPHKKSVIDSHLPPTRLQASSYQVGKAKQDAALIGPKTTQMVDELLSGDRPFQFLRRVQGILRLKAGGYSAEAIEYAAGNALTFRRFQLSYIKSCADHYQASGGRFLIYGTPKRDPDSTHLHGG